MKLSSFNYNLPIELIAQKPINPRDHSRLLIYNKKNETIEHKKFYDVVDYLNSGDVLFVNNSKVFSARLKASKKTGGKIEIFLIKIIDKKKNIWECLLGGRIKSNTELDLGDDLTAKIIKNNNGIWEVSFNVSYKCFLKIVGKIGWTPLPPYIKRDVKKREDLQDYQTIYANSDKTGSIAAPTAGLHFTDKLIKKIKNKGVEVLEGTLHVGLGTFSPIKNENILKHKMHSEDVFVSTSVINKIIKAKKEGRRVIAVGTTSARILESLVELNISPIFSKNKNYYDNKKNINYFENININNNFIEFSTSIFIYPGYKFQIIDGLITNFHLPKSSLMLLISALIGKKRTLEVYQEAINKKYRFFSYGDAMFII